MCSSVDSRTNKVIVEKLILLTTCKFKLDFFFFFFLKEIRHIDY